MTTKTTTHPLQALDVESLTILLSMVQSPRTARVSVYDDETFDCLVDGSVVRKFTDSDGFHCHPLESDARLWLSGIVETFLPLDRITGVQVDKGQTGREEVVTGLIFIRNDDE